MKVIAAYLLAVLGGNTSPSADDLKEILGSEDITELIAAGREKLASVPSGGGVAVSAPAVGAPAGGAPAAEPAKEEKKVEEKEESDDDMGFKLVRLGSEVVLSECFGDSPRVISSSFER